VSTAEERRWFAAVAMMETCALCGSYGVQVAHRNEGKGMGKKSDPWMTAPLCPECHQSIDSGRHLSRDERRALIDKAILRAHDWLIRNGLLILKR